MSDTPQRIHGQPPSGMTPSGEAPSIWINAGEFSGDVHGALLAEALLRTHPGIQLMGMGGDQMAAAGVDTLFRIESLSVMGATEIVTHLPKILRLLKDIKAAMRRLRPTALVVIDAPDFSFRVISIARSLNIPVYYYISPKVWAWRQNRVHFIRENTRRLISILPFEVTFYRDFNMEINYVGNPLVDLVDYPSIAHIMPQEGQIGILPGSRKNEITSLMPRFGAAARLMLAANPALSFACIKAPNMDEAFVRAQWPADVPLHFLPLDGPGGRWAAMRRCEMLFAASGTVTLESALAGVPTIVAYKLSRISYCIGRAVIKVPFISLPNLVLGEEVFPEHIQQDSEPEKLAAKALDWLHPERKHATFASIGGRLDTLRTMLGAPGSVNRAAGIILDDLQKK